MGKVWVMEQERTVHWRDYCVTLVILGLNIVGYILCTQIGEVVYNVGSINAEKVLVGKQYYRLVTAMFLHADAEHIVSNMIFLVGLGQMVEQSIGHFRFVVLYLLSGIGAGAFSIVYAVLTGHIYDAVGASGAIFGLIGALFILVVARDRRRRTHYNAFGAGNESDQIDILDQNGKEMPSAYESVSVGRMIFAIVYMVYSGARAALVDNAAHIGGLVCGLLIMSVMHVIETFQTRRTE